MKNISELLKRTPKIYMALVVLALEFPLFYLDNVIAPDIPLSMMYALSILFTLRYVDTSFAYLLAIICALGRTYSVWLFHIDTQLQPDAEVFFSNVTFFLLICYLMHAQMLARAKAEAALDDLSKMNLAIIRKAESGIEVFDSEGRCVLVNEAAAAILGTTVDVLQKESFRRYSSWRNTGLLKVAEEVMSTGLSGQFEAPIHTKYGKDIWCIATLGRIELNDGTYLLLVFNDISKFKQAVTEMGRAQMLAQIALQRAGAAERRIISISEETQQRIGQELHDDLGQQLTGIAFMTQVLSHQLKDLGLEREQHDAAKITGLVNDAVSKTRRLAHSLYPVELQGHGLREMLGQLSREVSNVFQIECELEFDEFCSIEDPDQVIHLYRICQEAISNAVKHGKASQIMLAVSRVGSELFIKIADNGSGGDMASLNEHSGLGMHTMRYRAEIIGAALAISTAAGGGLCVTVKLPQHQEELDAIH